jgi:hypothetical protein
MRKRIVHPTIGVIELDCLILTAENQTEKLVVFTEPRIAQPLSQPALLRSSMT